MVEVDAHTPIQQITFTSSVILKVSSRNLLEWRALISTFSPVLDLAVPSEMADPVVSLEPGLAGPRGNLMEGVKLLSQLYLKGV